jgi:hypothetical protein
VIDNNQIRANPPNPPNPRSIPHPRRLTKPKPQIYSHIARYSAYQSAFHILKNAKKRWKQKRESGRAPRAF